MRLTDINNIKALLKLLKDKVIITGGFSKYLLGKQSFYNKTEVDIILKDIKDLNCIDYLIKKPLELEKAIWHGNLMQRYFVPTKMASKIKNNCLDINEKWYLDVFVGENAGETILVDDLLCAVINEKNK